TLNTERVAIGGTPTPREGGMIGVVAQTWRDNPERRRPELHDELLQLWVESEVGRLTRLRLRQKLGAGAGGPESAVTKAKVGQAGPEGATTKLTFARLNQALSGIELELLEDEGLCYDDWSFVRPERVNFTGREAGYRYLRSKGNSIEGGTSEILRNIVAERVL